MHIHQGTKTNLSRPGKRNTENEVRTTVPELRVFYMCHDMGSLCGR